MAWKNFTSLKKIRNSKTLVDPLLYRLTGFRNTNIFITGRRKYPRPTTKADTANGPVQKVSGGSFISGIRQWSGVIWVMSHELWGVSVSICKGCGQNWMWFHVQRAKWWWDPRSSLAMGNCCFSWDVMFFMIFMIILCWNLLNFYVDAWKWPNVNINISFRAYLQFLGHSMLPFAICFVMPRRGCFFLLLPYSFLISVFFKA